MEHSDQNSKELQRVHDQAMKEASFIGRNYQLKIALSILYLIVAGVSAYTAGGHLYVYFKRTSQNDSIALLGAAALITILEALKFFPTKALMADLRNKVFSESINHQVGFALKVVLALIGFVPSVFLSITGAKVINQHTKETQSPVKLVSLDSINKRYDLMLADEGAVVAAASTITWDGKVVGKGQKLLLKSADRKLQIDQIRSVEIDSARAENNRRTTKWNQETAASSGWFQGFAGIAEAGAIIILFFLGNYEAGALSQVLANSPSTVVPSSTTVPVQRNPIDIHTLAEIIRNEVRAATTSPTAQQEPPKRQIGFTPHPTPTDPPGTQQPPLEPNPKTWQPPSVATGSNQDEEFFLTGNESPWILEMARKNANSNLGAWRAKMNKGEGVPDTNQRNINQWEARLKQIESLIEQKNKA